MALTVGGNDTHVVQYGDDNRDIWEWRYVGMTLTVDRNDQDDYDESRNKLLLQIHFVPEVSQQFGQNTQQKHLLVSHMLGIRAVMGVQV